MKKTRKKETGNEANDSQDNKEEITEKIKQTKTITQFMIYIFQLIEEGDFNSASRKYLSAVKKASETENLMELTSIISDLVFCEDNECEFSDWLDLWIHFFKKVSWEPEVVFWATIVEYDSYCSENYRKERGLEQNEIIEIAKMEHGFDGQNYILVPYMQNTIFSREMKENRIRHGQQTANGTSAILNRKLQNCNILKKSKLIDYEVVIRKYNSSRKDELLGHINIGICPFDMETWFNVEKNTILESFCMSDKKMHIDEQNERIWEAVTEFDKRGADVLIFPEIAMNRDTETYLRKKLITSHLNKLKLIFAGSCWKKDEEKDEGINEAILFNTKGNVLLRHTKKMAYAPYMKEAGVRYYENLGDTIEKMEFLDLPGVGRIAYMICADLTSNELRLVCENVRTNFIFTSAFTPTWGSMQSNAVSFVQNSAGAAVICNACAAYEDKGTDFHSYMVAIPRFQEKKVDYELKQGGTPHECAKKNCPICEHIVTIP